MSDFISRQAAIDDFTKWQYQLADCFGEDYSGVSIVESAIKSLEGYPSVQPESLTDDDFEAIRIHLSAYKERLCNQRRWKEAEEYQRIIERFMSFASAQPEWRWIPCSERLPEHWVMVLITTIYGDIEFGHYNEKEKTWEWLCESGTNYWEECAGVLAWMPLPEPYQAERRTDAEIH